MLLSFNSMMKEREAVDTADCFLKEFDFILQNKQEKYKLWLLFTYSHCSIYFFFIPENDLNSIENDGNWICEMKNGLAKSD